MQNSNLLHHFIFEYIHILCMKNYVMKICVFCVSFNWFHKIEHIFKITYLITFYMCYSKIEKWFAFWKWFVKKRLPWTVDHLARGSMKNAANCASTCELQDTWTSTFRTHIAVLGYCSRTTPGWGSYHIQRLLGIV